ncbi:hypothetical protein G4228_020404 [Cervus hanglu yarkandensis]|uniref:Uncharacterized protein n=1 Tax=Cervus hanglu yarkandensis TaxID=84702 RepID=A0A833WH22_9CERV|nr:hypothetical protein G4228_020404 [Cervus hanglu yarkandensis]
MLTEISEWLENHPQEVDILAYRNFEGMMEDPRKHLMGCIKNIFRDMLCPRGEVLTLCQLWSQGQQVILWYKDEVSMSQHAELWPRIPYWWGIQVKHPDLVHYLEHMKSCSHPSRLFLAGINLTENLEFVLIHPAWSLENVTLRGLPYLCAWVRGQCPGSATGCTNIIAGDFIPADGFVGDVNGWNRKLLGAEGQRMCRAGHRGGRSSFASCDVTGLNRKLLGTDGWHVGGAGYHGGSVSVRPVTSRA